MKARVPRFSVVLIAMVIAGAVSVTAFASATQEKAMGTAVYTGYLMDVACSLNGTGLDGSDVINSPWDHTKMCIVACKASGFGLMVKQGDAYMMVKFDKAGSDLAFNEIINKTKRDKNLVVSVEGMMKDGVLVVSSIKEANLL